MGFSPYLYNPFEEMKTLTETIVLAGIFFRRKFVLRHIEV